MMAPSETEAAIAIVRKVQIELLAQSFGHVVQEVCLRGIGPHATVENLVASLQRHLEESAKDWLARQLTGIE